MLRRVLLAIPVALALPAGAHASAVEVVRDPDFGPHLLRFVAEAGEANQLTIDFADGEWVVRDAGATLKAGAGCRTVAPAGEVRCTSEAIRTTVSVDLGDGNDTAAIIGAHTLVRAGAGDDRITGGAGDDELHGGGGRDELRGGAAGADRLHDDDVAAGALDADVLDGGPEAFPVGGGDIADYGDRAGTVAVDLATGAGPDGDRLSAIDVVHGGAAADVLRGHERPNLLRGGPGADLLEGAAADDTLAGEDGPDRLRGGTGSDLLSGEDGRDDLDGGDGHDTLNPGVRGDGRDALRCGAGRDVVLVPTFEDPVPRDCERLGSDDHFLTVPARLARRGRTIVLEAEGPEEARLAFRCVLRTTSRRRLARSRTVSVPRGRGVARLRLALPRGARLSRGLLDVRMEVRAPGTSGADVRNERFHVRVVRNG